MSEQDTAPSLYGLKWRMQMGGHRRTRPSWRTRPYPSGPKGSMKARGDPTTYRKHRPARAAPEVHYTRVEDVDTTRHYDQGRVLRTNEEWDIIREAFRRKRAA